MKTWSELKQACENSERFKDLSKEDLKKYKKEIMISKRFYDNERNLFEELTSNISKISSRYIIPYLLKLTNVILDKKPEYIQVKIGASGGKLSMPPFVEI